MLDKEWYTIVQRNNIYQSLHKDTLDLTKRLNLKQDEF